MENLPIGIAYVIDQSALGDQHLDFAKCKYIAIGLCTETSGGKAPATLTDNISGTIAQAFGVCKQSSASAQPIVQPGPGFARPGNFIR